VPAPRVDDQRFDEFLRRELARAHDWILSASVPVHLLEALRRKPGG